ncbi:uncharacterized protein EV422DRAFT_523521 [Fimicolochytrium jonesii]|uniref:uncharacterized protein n=1 Tax=Fimicolochytrium jonesii TaxID=1396493 RepID=UPI0022FEE536|nr:uncharacterized protein EV422DRAFT_523521 [Fimicolochytrium jonesii]KAI8823139.1 hypothetical protein EV422DRAFT_523521 [Fimicolochytrium jonesii]
MWGRWGVRRIRLVRPGLGLARLLPSCLRLSPHSNSRRWSLSNRHRGNRSNRLNLDHPYPPNRNNTNSSKPKFHPHPI